VVVSVILVFASDSRNRVALYAGCGQHLRGIEQCGV